MPTKKYNLNTKFIKAWIKQRGYSPTQFAADLEISLSLASGILNGDPQRKLTVFALAHIMKASLADVLAHGKGKQLEH